MYINYFVDRKWWFLPALTAVAATVITLTAYLIAVSQFGSDMVFMFRNLI